jgi:hypothetical protein
MLLTLIAMLAMPIVLSAQGRGRGGVDSRKCGKFVNCHDARDGRRDGRGPRGSRVGRHIWDDDDNDRRWRNRRVRRDRDGDGDFDRRDVLLGRRNRADRDGDGDFDRRDVRLGRRQRRNSRFNR